MIMDENNKPTPENRRPNYRRNGTVPRRDASAQEAGPTFAEIYAQQKKNQAPGLSDEFEDLSGNTPAVRPSENKQTAAPSAPAGTPLKGDGSEVFGTPAAAGSSQGRPAPDRPVAAADSDWDKWEAWATGKTDIMPGKSPVIRPQMPRRQPSSPAAPARVPTAERGAERIDEGPAVLRRGEGGTKVVFEDERDAVPAEPGNGGYSFASGARTKVPEPQPVKKIKKQKKQPSAGRAVNNISVVLIVLTIAIAIASMLYLGLQLRHKDEGEVADAVSAGERIEPPEQNPLSYKPVSPIQFTQTYTKTFPQGIQQKFIDLYQQNSDLVGWLTVPETCIDFPVYQTDDNSYYLKHDNYGSYTKYGAIFLDEYCDYVGLSKNTTLYGHHFEDNELIFAEIEHYDELDFYKARPVIEFDTLFRDYKWKVFAAFRTNGTDEGDNGYLFYYPAADMTDASFTEFYNEIMQRSYLKTSVDVIATDKILTLSTCTYFFDRGSAQNARFVLMARLVREGESENVDTSSASVTENVRYPQLYYDVFGGTNPWANGSKWYPVQG
ncbi:MAG: sortase [Clostridia bacterium]|nr:sortase [Clostridia bacterium]